MSHRFGYLPGGRVGPGREPHPFPGWRSWGTIRVGRPLCWGREPPTAILQAGRYLTAAVTRIALESLRTREKGKGSKGYLVTVTTTDVELYEPD
jgi:hypothetical protein